MNLKKTLVCIAIATTLSACGSSSKKKDPVKVDTPDPIAPVQTIVNGTAIKGIISNGIITVFKYVDGAPVALTEDELEGSEFSTDEDGVYSITLIDYEGPLKVQVSPSTDTDNPTMMLCDVPDGCGDIAFGQLINLTTSDSSFSLSSITTVDPTLTEPVLINISAVTHIATTLIEAQDTISAETISTTLSEVGNSLGIIGDITQLTPTDINSNSAVAGEDNSAELRYGLINAAIAGALFDQLPVGVTASDRLAEATADLVDNDGEFIVAQDDDISFELALTDVLTQASGIATVLAQSITDDTALSDTGSVVDLLDQTSTNLVNENIVRVAQAGEDGRVETVSDQVIDGDAIAQAAGLVDDIRVFANLFDITKSSGADVSSQADAAVMLAEDANAMLLAEKETFTLLADIAGALSDIQMAIDDETTDATTFNLADWLTAEDSATATGTVNFDRQARTFSITALSNGQQLNLSVAITQENSDMSVKLAISGEVLTAGMQLTIDAASFAQLNFAQAVSEEILVGEDSPEPTSGQLNLTVTLAQLATEAVTNPISFTGIVQTTLVPVTQKKVQRDWDNYNYEETNQFGWLNYQNSEIVSEQILLPQMLSLSGELSALAGDSIQATLTVNLPDAADFEAAGLPGYGKEIVNGYTISASADGNTINHTMANAFTAVEVFTPGTSTGEWSSHYTETSLDPTIGLYERIDSSMINSTDLGNEYIFTTVVHSGEYDYAVRLILTPVEGGYIVGQKSKYYPVTAETDNPALLNDDGELLDEQGEIIALYADPDYFYTTAEEAFQGWFHLTEVLPETITDGISYAQAQLVDGNNYGVDPAIGGMLIAEPELISNLSAGSELSFNTQVIRPYYPDSISISISDNGNEITTTVLDQQTSHSILDMSSAGNFTYASETTNRYGSDNQQVVSTTEDVGFTEQKIVIVKYHGDHYVELIEVTPQDTTGDSVADTFQNCSGWGSSYQDGNLVDYAGELINPYCNNYYDYDQALKYVVSFTQTPLAITSLIESNIQQVNLEQQPFDIIGWIDDIGYVGKQLNDEEVGLLVAGSTNTFDAKLIEAASVSGLEDADHYLAANAAFSLAVNLGDYSVILELMATRTALDDGDLSLQATYSLPNEDGQRSFTITHNTATEIATITNEQGVTISLNLADDEQSEGEVTLGTIMVDGEAAATIVDRDGLILIIYASGAVESI